MGVILLESTVHFMCGSKIPTFSWGVNEWSVILFEGGIESWAKLDISSEGQSLVKGCIEAKFDTPFKCYGNLCSIWLLGARCCTGTFLVHKHVWPRELGGHVFSKLLKCFHPSTWVRAANLRSEFRDEHQSVFSNFSRIKLNWVGLETEIEPN